MAAATMLLTSSFVSYFMYRVCGKHSKTEEKHREFNRRSFLTPTQKQEERKNTTKKTESCKRNKNRKKLSFVYRRNVCCGG